MATDEVIRSNNRCELTLNLKHTFKSILKVTEGDTRRTEETESGILSTRSTTMQEKEARGKKPLELECFRNTFQYPSALLTPSQLLTTGYRHLEQTHVNLQLTRTLNLSVILVRSPQTVPAALSRTTRTRSTKPQTTVDRFQ